MNIKNFILSVSVGVALTTLLFSLRDVQVLQSPSLKDDVIRVALPPSTQPSAIPTDPLSGAKVIKKLQLNTDRVVNLSGPIMDSHVAVEISSNAMDALVFGEDMFSKSNVYGMADAFILGSAIGSPITLLSKGPSAIGTANNINKRRNISEEINDLYDVHQDPNTSASEKAVVKGQIINKLAELKQVENNLASFYVKIYLISIHWVLFNHLTNQ